MNSVVWRFVFCGKSSTDAIAVPSVMDEDLATDGFGSLVRKVEMASMDGESVRGYRVSFIQGLLHVITGVGIYQVADNDEEALDFLKTHNCVLLGADDMKEDASSEGSSEHSPTPSISASEQMERREKLCEGIDNELYNKFHGKVFDLGVKPFKSMTLRIPTLDGVAARWVGWDIRLHCCEGDMDAKWFAQKQSALYLVVRRERFGAMGLHYPF